MRTAGQPERSLARTELTLAALLLVAFIAALIWMAPQGGTGSSSGLLPFTTSDISLFLVTATAALATGAALIKRSGRA